MDLNIPVNAAAGAAIMLIAMSVAVLAKAAQILESATERLRDFNDGIQDPRMATGSLRTEVIELRTSVDLPPRCSNYSEAPGPWPSLHSGKEKN